MKTKRKFAMVLCAMFLVSYFSGIGLQKAEAVSVGYITKAYTDKARYNPGDPVVISADMQNASGSAWSGTLYLQILHNETSVYSTSKTVSLSNNQPLTATFNWTPASTDFQGYLVKVYTSDTDY